jgi:hypothetical protein
MTSVLQNILSGGKPVYKKKDFIKILNYYDFTASCPGPGLTGFRILVFVCKMKNCRMQTAKLMTWPNNPDY